MPPLPKRIGKYEIRGVLGAGAMATVYQAYDPVIERTLAIKVVDKARLDASESVAILSRFAIEARAAGRLQHPNIVAVYDAGEHGDLVYLVMECVFGRPLAAFLQAEDFRGEPDKVCDIVLQVLAALGYSHGQGVIHRDVKPANLIVSREGVIKVADFGIARIESSNLTQTGDLIGTPSYMSPEQFAGETADQRTDLYAVSVIFYELLTRKRPFEGPNNAVIMHRVFTETPAPPSALNPLLSARLDPIVLRGISKDPLDRFQSAREYQQAVQSALGDKLLADVPPAAAPPTLQPGVLRAIRAQRAVTGAGEASVPSVTRPGATVAPLRTGGRNDTRPVVMFVDDEVRILTALGAIFRPHYRVHIADDPVKALEMIKRLPVQVLVSDQRMPGMLGVELLRLVREMSPRTVRILLTGYSDLASIVGSINEGEVWRFINKPWDAQDIQRVVAEAVGVANGIPDVPAWQMPTPPQFDEAILALDPSDELAPQLLDAFGKRNWVVRATSVDQAVGLLGQHEVAVLVVDLEAASTEIRTLVHLLKQEYPQILTIAVTRAADAELLIELINEAQIYRFLSKPVNQEQLVRHVEAALNRYHAYKATPELTRVAQKVEPAKITEPQLSGRLLDRLRALRGRFNPANR